MADVIPLVVTAADGRVRPADTDDVMIDVVPTVPNFIAQQSNLVIQTSDVYAIIPGMSITPGAGTWDVSFTSSGTVDKNARYVRYALFANGVEIPESVRRGGGTANNIHGVACVARITVGAGQAIDVRWRLDSTGSSPTAGIEARTLFMSRVS